MTYSLNKWATKASLSEAKAVVVGVVWTTKRDVVEFSKMSATNRSVIIFKLVINVKVSSRGVLICLLMAKMRFLRCSRVSGRVSVLNPDQNLFTKQKHQNKTIWIQKNAPLVIKLIVTKLQPAQKLQPPLNNQMKHHSVSHPHPELNLGSNSWWILARYHLTLTCLGPSKTKWPKIYVKSTSQSPSSYFWTVQNARSVFQNKLL